MTFPRTQRQGRLYRICVLVGLVAACGTKNRTEPAPPPLPNDNADHAQQQEPAQIDAAPALATEGARVDEAGARAILARAFRDLGFRILHDVPVSGAGFELTLDGFDPRLKVGFEYVDTRELGTDLDPAERQALARSELRVLVVDAGHLAAIAAAATSFLQKLEPDRKPKRR